MSDKDISEDKILDTMAEERKDQPILKTCPLCGGELGEVYDLVNIRRRGRIKGAREYGCKNCAADIAIHFAPIERRRVAGQKPVFSKPMPIGTKPCVVCGKPANNWTPGGYCCDSHLDDGTGGCTS